MTRGGKGFTARHRRRNLPSAERAGVAVWGLIGRLLVLALLTALGSVGLILCLAGRDQIARIMGGVALTACAVGMVLTALGALRIARRREHPLDLDPTAEEQHE
jgi:hypothetical protein